MSPAGYWPQLRAAIEAGADAVYFGLKHFTARAKVGFAPEELPEAMRELHRRGVRGYVTFNALVFDTELAEAARSLAAIAEAGADALIVQDLGILKLARAVAPGLPLHASTQMSLTSAEGIRLAQSLGVTRVIMARELSLAEVRAIRASTDCELEMFVHGALCVSYSGQCFSSEAWGGRSANRGQCAQTCRLPYEMIVDGETRPLGDARYLLSPGDLYALRQVPEIIGIGVSALKIEGRYKDADYVALTTSAYRKAVDDACAGTPPTITAAEKLQLEQVYSRGFGSYFVTGTDHQRVVRGRAPRHRGVLMGRVLRVATSGVLIEPSPAHALAPLKPGDGVVLDAADWRSPEEPEEGGRVYQVEPRPGGLEVRLGNRAVDFSRVRPGDLLWRTDDPEVARGLRPLTEASAPVRKLAVRVRATARQGQPLATEWAAAGRAVAVASNPPLGEARNHALDAATLRGQFGRLGGTPFELADVELEIDGAPFAPVSLLNRIRRQAVDGLLAALSSPTPRDVRDSAAALEAMLPASPRAHPSAIASPRLHLLVRTPGQLDAALECRPASITLDYLELYGLEPSVRRIQSAGIEARVASPRVLKPSEERVVHFLLKLGCPILVRSSGLLEGLRDRAHPDLFGDFSLNAANVLTAAELFRLGLARLTPGHDLDAAQIAALAGAVGGDRIEAVAYQHLPVFHTEHCVFCRFLSTGTSHLDCGHPCEKHRVALRDGNGRAHPVMADVGCRNTVFGAEAQEASRHLESWLRAGIRHFRLEFVHESPAQVDSIAREFQDALEEGRGSAELAARLRRSSPQGTTEGSLLIAIDTSDAGTAPALREAGPAESIMRRSCLTPGS